MCSLKKSEKTENLKMDSRIGLDLIVEDEEYTTKLGSGKTLRDIHKNRKLS